MNYISSFFALMLTAVFSENIVFSRGLGSSWAIYLIKNPKDLFKCTGIMAASTAICAAMGYPLRNLLYGNEYSYVLVPMMYIGCMAVAYVFVYFIMQKVFPSQFMVLENKLGGTVFNCAVLGSLLIPASQRLSFVSSMGYAIGSSIGFLIAVVITGYGIERLKLKNVPEPFKGLPITLIYLGLLSLAFYGLIGHQLPT